MNTTTTKPTVKSAIDALRTAETALAIACSYRDITRGKDGDCILGALETLRDTLSAHNKSAPGRNAMAHFGAMVLTKLGNGEIHDLFDTLTKAAANLGFGTIDRDGTLVLCEDLPDPPLHRLDARELAMVLAGLRAYQECYDTCAGDLPDTIASVASAAETLEPLDLEEIDALCVRLNMEGA